VGRALARLETTHRRSGEGFLSSGEDVPRRFAANVSCGVSRLLVLQAVCTLVRNLDETFTFDHRTATERLARTAPSAAALGRVRVVATVFRLHGSASLAISDTNPSVLALVRSHLDPYEPAPGTAGDALLVLEAASPDESPRVDDIQNPAGDDVVTAAGDDRYHIMLGGRWCTLPQALEQPRFVYQAGFPLARLFRLAVRPALQIAMVRQGAAALHATAVDIGGQALLVGGWSESGKTETALAFVEEGARFVSDKWTIVTSDGVAGAFPISVGIRRWVLPYTPRLRRSLPTAARVQLKGAGAVASLARPIRGRPPARRIRSVVIEALDKAVALADRTPLTPSQVRSCYGQPTDGGWTTPLGTLALLTTVPHSQRVTVGEAGAPWAARRLARAAAFERRGLFDLYERARYAFPEVENARAESERADERFLGGMLSAIRILDVRAPFPSDPRAVAEAIRRAL
jgi:hypothetical protein